MNSGSVKIAAFVAGLCAIACIGGWPGLAAAGSKDGFSLKGGYFGPMLSLAKFNQKIKPATGPSQQISGTGKLIGAIVGYDLSSKTRLWALEADFGVADQTNRQIAYSASLKARAGLHKSFGTPYLTAGYTFAGIRNPASIAPRQVVHGIQLGAGFEKPLSRVLSGRLDYSFSRFFNAGNSTRQRSHALRAALIFHITR